MLMFSPFAISMLAPFLGMVGGTSILRGLRASAKQVGESTKGGGVGVFHACIVFFLPVRVFTNASEFFATVRKG